MHAEAGEPTTPRADDVETQTVETQTVEIQPADPRLRLQILGALIVVAALAAVALWWLDARLGALERLASEEPARAGLETKELAVGLFWLVGGSTAAFGLYFVWLGARALRDRRFPPRGARVLRDTRILRDEAARRQGVVALLVGVSLLIAGVGLPLFAEARLDALFVMPGDPRQLQILQDEVQDEVQDERRRRPPGDQGAGASGAGGGVS